MENRQGSLKTINEIEENLITGCIDEFCKNVEWHEPAPNPLGKSRSLDDIQKEFKQLIRSIFFNEQEKERIYKGVRLIKENLSRVSNEKICLAELKAASQQMFHHLAEIIDEDKELLNLIFEIDAHKFPKDAAKINGHALDKVHPISEEFGISESTMVSFYEIGYQLFNEHQIEDARCVFQFLSILNAFSHEIWLALGMCHQKVDDWFSAICAYSMASLMHPENPLPYIHCAECFIANNDKENALGSIRLAEYFMNGKNKSKLEPIIKDIKKKL
jgi:type III secretion system low calcium response chaperone LcrH/SycD